MQWVNAQPKRMPLGDVHTRVEDEGLPAGNLDAVKLLHHVSEDMRSDAELRRVAWLDLELGTTRGNQHAPVRPKVGEGGVLMAVFDIVSPSTCHGPFSSHSEEFYIPAWWPPGHP